MVQLFTKCLGASLLLASSVTANNVSGGCISRKLSYPKIVDMDELSAANASLTLDLEWVEVNPGFGDQDGYSNDIFETVCGTEPFLTRALGGSVPGPTLTVSPGTSMKIKFRNRLTYQPDSKSSHVVVEANATDPENEYVFTNLMDFSRLNKFNDPDVANLHFHGLHVPGTLPGDDTTLEIFPQEEYEYIIDIPVDHEPGLHWVHPHHHGSSALHMAGGAALALIVKDDIASLPLDIREATERVLVFQEWDVEEADEAAAQANDRLFLESLSKIDGRERFITVNGQYQPITEIPVGKWERWRFLYAGWQDSPLNFGPTSAGNTADCEFHLLAKDGIYISDYPRGPMLSAADSSLPIPPGGRADFMVRCNRAGGTTRFRALGQDNILVVNGVKQQDEVQSTSSLTTWTKTSAELPDYLQSVLNSPVSEGCNCNYRFDGNDDRGRVNGQSYSPGDNFIHTTYLGAVVERSLKGTGRHSYHQHVYPFQLISFPDEATNNADAYFKIGDWHDTYQAEEQREHDRSREDDRVTIRYKTTDIAGKMMVHCHNSLHSDAGMIQKEYIRDTTVEGYCQCDIFGPIDGIGVFEDFKTIEWYSSTRQGAMIGFACLVPLLVASIFLGGRL